MSGSMPVTSKMRIAVVGCGHWGQNLVRVFSTLKSLAVVCDADPLARRKALEIDAEVEVVSSFASVISSSIDAVVIATPAETHYDLAKAALEADKDVFVEKPLALAYGEGAHLVRLASERRRILMVGHVLEYHPAVLKLLDLISEGEIGDVRYAYSNRLSLGKVRREENILWSFAPHDIAVILRLMDDMPVQVGAHGGAYLQPNIPDVTVTNMLFQDGKRAHIHVSWLHPFREQRLVVVGSRKMASFDDIERKLIVYDLRVELTEADPLPVSGDHEIVAFSSDEPLLLEGRAFLDALSSRVPPTTDGDSALRVLKVLQAAEHSMTMNGGPIEVGP